MKQVEGIAETECSVWLKHILNPSHNGQIVLKVPKVRSEVTPRVTLAGIASGLIQNEIHDITTIKAEGM